MLDHISDSDEEPPEQIEQDPDEDYEAERILEAEEAAHQTARDKRFRERLPLALLDIARVPGMLRKQGN
jgi:hypothetical protein